MKVKDFIEVYDDAYLTIETKEATYTDCLKYAEEAEDKGFYKVPIIIIKDRELNSQVLEKEITSITAYSLKYNEEVSMFFIECDNEFN